MVPPLDSGCVTATLDSTLLAASFAFAVGVTLLEPTKLGLKSEPFMSNWPCALAEPNHESELVCALTGEATIADKKERTTRPGRCLLKANKHTSCTRPFITISTVAPCSAIACHAHLIGINLHQCIGWFGPLCRARDRPSTHFHQRLRDRRKTDPMGAPPTGPQSRFELAGAFFRRGRGLSVTPALKAPTATGNSWAHSAVAVSSCIAQLVSRRKT